MIHRLVYVLCHAAADSSRLTRSGTGRRGGVRCWLHPSDPLPGISRAAPRRQRGLDDADRDPDLADRERHCDSVGQPPSPTPTGPAVEVGRGPSTRAEVALTFHGAGDPALARQLLALLASRQVTMTVMVVGTWLSDNPSMAAAILGGGHELGNHTWTHPTLSELPEAGVRTEIQRCRDLLVSLTGQPGTYFRQSAAQNSTPLIRSVAGSLGYRTCLSYDIDSLDWTDPSTATVRNAVKAATAGSIVSMHLGHPVTISALPGILDDLTARGLTPVTTSTLLRP